MGLGIIMGAMQGAGDAGQNIAQANTRLWDTQALQQQQSDLDTVKQQSLINLENQNALDMLSAKSANDDAQREQMAARLQAAAAPALQQATLANAQADPAYTWVPSQAARNPDGTAAPGTPQVAPSIADLSPDDLQKYAPTPEQQSAAFLTAARSTGDIPPTGMLQAYLQDQAGRRADAMMRASRQFSVQQDRLRDLSGNPASGTCSAICRFKRTHQ